MSSLRSHPSLSEAKEFLLENALEDGQVYSGTPLLEGWTESLIGETSILIHKSREVQESWEERAPLLRKRNLLWDIEKALTLNKEQNDGGSIFTKR